MDNEIEKKEENSLTEYRLKKLTPLIEILANEASGRLSNPEELAGLKTSQVLFYLHLLMSIFPVDKKAQGPNLNFFINAANPPVVIDQERQTQWNRDLNGTTAKE